MQYGFYLPTRGALATRTPSCSAHAINCASALPDKCGSVITSVLGSRSSSRNRASTGPNSPSPPRIGCPLIRRPVCPLPVDTNPTT